MSAQNNLPRLRVGAGPSDASGGLCGMQVISRENGDTEITDLPACADPMLARVVQQVNDTICAHRDGDLLCPDCSVKVLDLAHRTVGTALDMSGADRARVYVRLALDEAESVARDDEDGRATEARRVVAAWLDGGASRSEVTEAAYAANAAANAAAYAAAYAAANAAYAANDANAAAYAAHAAHAAAYAAYAANAAGYAAGRDLLTRAHKLIDRFEALTGVKATPVEPETVEAAIAQMVRTA